MTKNSPRGRSTSFTTHSGSPNCSGVSLSVGICRNTIEMLPRCLKIETRNRARSPKAKPKSALPFSCKLALATLRGDALHQTDGVVRLEHLGFQLSHATVQSKNRRLPHHNVDVAGTLLHAGLQQFVNQNRCHCFGLVWELKMGRRPRINRLSRRTPENLGRGTIIGKIFVEKILLAVTVTGAPPERRSTCDARWCVDYSQRERKHQTID